VAQKRRKQTLNKLNLRAIGSHISQHGGRVEHWVYAANIVQCV